MTFTRRDFLRDSSLAVAAMAGVASGTARDATRPGAAETSVSTTATPAIQGLEPPVRIAVVGGNFGAQFYWHTHPQCKVVAVSDLLPERLQYLRETYGCGRAYPSLEALLDDDSLQCDAVAVMTDATKGVDHTLACLFHGKHVIAGSPAALSVDDARRLRQAVLKSGLTYMLSETSYYQQSVISARKWFEEGRFGTIFSSEAEYHHPGLEKLFVDEAGRPTWRYGLPPMLYAVHCTGHLLGVTGERLKTVTAYGWGDDDPILKANPFNNPFWCETALFQTELGNAFRAAVYWRGALGIAERGVWMGSKMSFFSPEPNGLGPIIRRTEEVSQAALIAGDRSQPVYEKYDQQAWWETDMLPEPLRHNSGHDGSHTFLTHEFVSALVEGRRPAMDVDFAIDAALPGIIAHESALAGGKLMTVPRANQL